MDEPYLGEIRPIASTYAPRNWAFCNGQILNIAQNQGLFALLGTQFGGNGVNTFALPDLRSRIPVGAGQMVGGSTYTQGQTGGQDQVALQTTQIPPHTHQLTATLQTSDSPESSDPTNNLPATGGRNQFSSGAANATMGAITGTTATAGASQPHENRMPYVAINYVIALVGLYPSRS